MSGYVQLPRELLRSGSLVAAVTALSPVGASKALVSGIDINTILAMGPSPAYTFLMMVMLARVHGLPCWDGLMMIVLPATK